MAMGCRLIQFFIFRRGKPVEPTLILNVSLYVLYELHAISFFSEKLMPAVRKPPIPNQTSANVKKRDVEPKHEMKVKIKEDQDSIIKDGSKTSSSWNDVLLDTEGGKSENKDDQLTPTPQLSQKDRLAVELVISRLSPAGNRRVSAPSMQSTTVELVKDEDRFRRASETAIKSSKGAVFTKPRSVSSPKPSFLPLPKSLKPVTPQTSNLAAESDRNLATKPDNTGQKPGFIAQKPGLIAQKPGNIASKPSYATVPSNTTNQSRIPAPVSYLAKKASGKLLFL